MPTTLVSTLKVDAGGFGATTATRAVHVQAFDHVEVTVPAADGGTDGEVTAEVQPGGAGQARLVFITASAYPVDGGTPELAFTVEVGGADSTLPLDGPLLLAGAAIDGLLGSLREAAFSNRSNRAVDVQILVGRDAVATP